uniref:G-protein coupled receptors family 1 profile domain-containing protein n=1 Tax=Cynoglossus semilaevis TaxID=244447 RepID=A0A3P8WQU6_CYNSE
MMGNVTLITMFFLSGLDEKMSHRFILFSLTLLCYCLILLVNISLVLVIILDRNLHEPMYILLCTFCINGLYGTAGFYPKFLWDLLSPLHVISYSGCLVQAQVMYSFACGDLSILAVMAYDRYVAICRPLQYHAVMSKQRVLKLAFFSWFTPACILAVNISLTSRLRLCSAFICIGTRAGCPAVTLINNIVACITIVFYFFHGVFIVWTYMCLVRMCVNSVENRAKFMQTCVPHLLSLTTFLLTILFDVMNMRFSSVELPPHLKNLLSVEFLVIPPLMNPLIYGFKLTKIRKKFVALLSIKNT